MIDKMLVDWQNIDFWSLLKWETTQNNDWLLLISWTSNLEIGFQFDHIFQKNVVITTLQIPGGTDALQRGEVSWPICPCALKHGQTWQQFMLLKPDCTWFNIQRVGVDLDVQILWGGWAEVLQDAVDGLGDVVRHRLGELHLAVDDHAALPEVKNFQFLEARQVRLQERQQLETEAESDITL